MEVIPRKIGLICGKERNIGSVIKLLCSVAVFTEMLWFITFSSSLLRITDYKTVKRCCDESGSRSRPDNEVDLFRRSHEHDEINDLQDVVTFCNQTFLPEHNILSMERPGLMSRFKNPCWISEGRFLCIPYFYLVGVAKCGTTDLFEKIAAHPEFRRPSIKEPNWLSTKRFKNATTASLQYYATKSFGQAAKAIQKSGRNGKQSRLITGEASINTFDGSMLWQLMPENRGRAEPVMNNPDYIYHLNPDTKILINVRNPVDRLWSEYLAFTKDKEPTAKKFHMLVIRALKVYNKCLQYRTVRSCMYSKRLADYSSMSDAERNSSTPGCGRIPKDIIMLRRGVYHVFIKDYLKVFQHKQILIQRLEDISADQTKALNKTYDFLGLSSPDEKLKRHLTALGIRNSRKPDRRKKDMLLKTRHILRNFYKPHNKELAKLLNDTKFMYE